jgi:hypothetical protein
MWAPMMRCAYVPVAATFFLLAGCIDEPVLLEEDAGTGVLYSNPVGTSTQRWPGGVIHFRFSEGEWSDPEGVENLVIDEMERWKELTRIDFIRDQDCVDCLQISGGGDHCETEIGNEPGQLRYMHLPDSEGCGSKQPVVMHELGHAIGLKHEQQRSDRDLYVTFHSENAADTADFEIAGSTYDAVGDYDYTSVMGYRAFAHTANGRMTLTRNDSWGLFDEGEGSVAAKRPWRTGVTTAPVTGFLVGDFDGVGGDDVVRRRTSGRFEMSASALDTWRLLGATDAPIDELRVGQFDTDARDDLVWADGTQWRYSSGGDGPWLPLLGASTTWATMRVVDFDGDGDSDFVRILNNRFQVAMNGRAAFVNVPNSTAFDVPMTIDQMLFGDFVGDAHIDALREKPGNFDFGLEASSGLSGTFGFFRSGAYPSIQSLRAIDADEQGRIDLIRIGSEANPDPTCVGSTPDPECISYEIALDGVGGWTMFGSEGVEDFGKLVIGNFDESTAGQEMLVNGYYPPRDPKPTHTDRGGVAHIYYPQILLSRAGRARWEYWDDAPGSSNLAQYKVGDFDGDGLDDLFEVSTSWLGITSTKLRTMNPDPGPDPSQYHANVGWKTLTYNVGPAQNIAVGHFIGDARSMDVLRKRDDGVWEVQDGGEGVWTSIMYDPSTSVSEMAFADLDGNGITDVFISRNGVWKVSWDARSTFTTLTSGEGTALSLLRFGDFTGDGDDDIVTSFSGAWWIWTRDNPQWTKLRDETADIRNFRFGHFDRDNRLDVFRVNPTNALHWEIVSGAGPGGWTRQTGFGSLAMSSISPAQMAIGHFSGDAGEQDDIIGYIPALADDDWNGW